MMRRCTFVGVQPWLPWPLSTWSWWTEPIRAEYLAVVRLGMGTVLLIDQLWQYYPCLNDLYGLGSLGSPDVFAHYSQAPAWHWSIFYGLGHGVFQTLSLLLTLVGGLLLGLRLAWHRHKPHNIDDLPVWPIGIWLGAAIVWTLGVWARLPSPSILTWVVPVTSWVLASVFVNLRTERVLVGVWAVTLLLSAIGLWLWFPASNDAHLAVRQYLSGWGANATLLRASFFVWMACTFMLTVGLASRLNAVLVWVLAVSFTNLNPHIDIAGDAVRNIVLLYLMLSPSGAVWSIDAWVLRHRSPVFIPSWPLRLLFIQLVCIYFFNGLFKLLGQDWRMGNSVYYVLTDLTIARTSYDQLFVPMWLLRIATWSVLAWELTFPLAVCWKPTRVAALWFGLLFHIGSMALMELGGFGRCMLVLYLPLLPWDRWLGTYQTFLKRNH